MVAPLFNTDLLTLYKRVRVDTVDDNNTGALIEQAVTEVRLGFYNRLGRTRAQTIAGYAIVDNPSTDEEGLRALAAAAEAIWLMWLLLQRLPHLFLDNKASVGDDWNDVPLTRDTADEDMLNRLKAQLDEYIGMLADPAFVGGATKITSIANESPRLLADIHPGLYPLGRNTSIGSIY